MVTDPYVDALADELVQKFHTTVLAAKANAPFEVRFPLFLECRRLSYLIVILLGVKKLNAYN